MPLTARIQSPDELFSALDGRAIHVGGQRWTVTVFAVHDEGSRRWVQVGLTSNGSARLVTFSDTRATNANLVAHALATWLSETADKTVSQIA